MSLVSTVVTAIIIGCIFISGCLDLTSKNNGGDQEYVFIIYENREIGVSIKYPDTWAKLENLTKGVLVSFMSDKSDARYGVFTVFFSVTNSLDPAIFLDILTMHPNNTFMDSYKMYLDKMYLEPKFTDFFILDSYSTILANRTAYSVLFTFKEGGRTFKRLDTFTLDGLFLLSYIAEETYYDNYIGTVEKMTNSFEILI